MEDWKRLVEPYTRPLFFAHSRVTRGKTLGVRGMVIEEGKRVLLVEHTYLEGWWLPGGGVDAMETAGDAVIRELQEEAGVTPLERPKLLSIHSNERFFPGDHVLVYRVDRFEQGDLTSHGEIKQAAFFDFDALPDNINGGSLRRIQEVTQGFPPDPLW
ncbi:NUDIX domain-containing protein [Asticcacaulis sp. YBE204]|uniref:NUDIX domain-containing protein n=1 Tax=Asticcacaulis sp. YBE204 TaxID=1282363 RepID=UPI0003C3D9D6|nr:NUDIX domain-containing protein [Asticcacaulis sp. YBE204]ESQ80092.1 DNA mismatch repair protein MutT [Asticcacaulis sp. YBE204]